MTSSELAALVAAWVEGSDPGVHLPLADALEELGQDAAAGMVRRNELVRALSGGTVTVCLDYIFTAAVRRVGRRRGDRRLRTDGDLLFGSVLVRGLRGRVPT
jgi:hypothetical protein